MERALMVEQVRDDAGLLRDIANGDDRAFALLVERHIDAAHRRARAVLGSHDAADDVIQDVFLKLWRDPQRWQPGVARFSTWLYRVVSNACIDRLRRTRREDGPDDGSGQPDPAPAPDAFMIASERARRVHSALETLSERQRQAITLSHFDGYSNIEAAEIMNTTIEAIESLLSRARRRLRTLLAAELSELLD